MKRLIMILLVTALELASFRADASGDGNADSGIATLEIACTGLKEGERALYDVFSPKGVKIFSVALQGSGTAARVSRRITGLQPGLYRVAGANWNWSYEESPGSMELQASPGEPAVFEFTARKRSALPVHYEDGKLNRFRRG